MINKKLTKETLLVGFSLFSMFFGGGNLLFPLSIGVINGENWYISIMGFLISSVVLPILGILAINKAGEYETFVGKDNKLIYMIYLIIIMGIILFFIIPRAGALIYEIVIFPNISSGKTQILFAIIFYLIAGYITINPQKIINRTAKVITPIILFGIVIIVVENYLQGMTHNLGFQRFEIKFFKKGFIEGYQVFDGIMSSLFGMVIISTLLKNNIMHRNRNQILKNGGILSGCLLAFVYIGLAFVGTKLEIKNIENISRVEIFNRFLIMHTNGMIKIIFKLCLFFACLSTAIGLIAVVAQFLEKFYKINYKRAVIYICILTTVFSTFKLEQAITISTPLLEIIYPITIILIELNLLGIQELQIKKISIYVTLCLAILELFFGGILQVQFLWSIPLISLYILYLYKKYIIKRKRELMN